ncbi:hypothetical protein GCM10027580_16020 [Corynebacterium faecale]
MVDAVIGAVDPDGVCLPRQFEGLVEHLALLADLVVAETQESECLHIFLAFHELIDVSTTNNAYRRPAGISVQRAR